MAASLVLGCACSVLAGQQSSAESWQGEPVIQRLAPSEFPTIPRDVVNYLLHQSYTIPQAFDVAMPHNVVRGDFDGDRLLDWAVLGTRKGFSEILIFWRGSAANVGRLALSKDAYYLQSTGGMGGEIGYSRSIAAVGREEILRYHRSFGGSKPPPITHSGIEDRFVNKASSIYYYYRQQWLVLQGAD